MLYPPGTKPPQRDRAHRVPRPTRNATREREEECGHLSPTTGRWGPGRINRLHCPRVVARVFICISTNGMSSPPHHNRTNSCDTSRERGGSTVRLQRKRTQRFRVLLQRKDSPLYPSRSGYSLLNASSPVNMILWKANNVPIPEKKRFKEYRSRSKIISAQSKRSAAARQSASPSGPCAPLPAKPGCSFRKSGGNPGAQAVGIPKPAELNHPPDLPSK